MNGSHIVAWLTGAITLLVVLAAFSRIVMMPQAPQYVTNGANALTRLFNGAFGY